METVANETYPFGAGAEINISEPIYSGMWYLITCDGLEDIALCKETEAAGYDFGIAFPDGATWFYSIEPGVHEVKIEILE